jgi:hypothetical protein
VARLSRRGILRAALVMIVIANVARVIVLLLHGSAPQLWGNTFAHLDSIAAGILLAVLLESRAPDFGHAMRARIDGLCSLRARAQGPLC